MKVIYERKIMGGMEGWKSEMNKEGEQGESGEDAVESPMCPVMRM
jgi:hypothetical protein